MKRINRLIVLCLICLTVFVSGCISNGPANGNESSAASAMPNANRTAEPAGTTGSQTNAIPMPGSPTPPPEPPGSSEAKPPPTLLGSYSIIEVHHKGLIDMISAENTTQIIFTSDGKFSRMSKKGGEVDHSDSGDFRVEGQDQLVLVIHESKQRIQDPPVVRRHKIELSPDGTELRMLSGKGLTAMFRRTSPLPGR